MESIPILSNATAIGPGHWVKVPLHRDFAEAQQKSYQVTVTGSGYIAANVRIEFSNDGVGIIQGPTLELSGNNLASTGFPYQETFELRRANIISISGNGAAVIATMGG